MEKSYVLEVTLISAQGLKEPSPKLRSMQTYATAWIDSSVKLRTCVDRVGGRNPTWNDKFLFKVSSEFLSSETSGVSVEIFAVGVLRDTLLGTVRFLVSNFLPSCSVFNAVKTPSFNAVQVRRASGRYHGILNIGAAVLDGIQVPAMAGVSAIGFRDLIGESLHPRTQRSIKKSKSTHRIAHENSFRDSDYHPDSDSTKLSPSTASTALRKWNEMLGELEGTKHARSSSDVGGLVSWPRKAAFPRAFSMFNKA
ncbi:hypothetical protein DITRI_Ditri13aG0044300 [Diplodiscus trichospermus]